MDKQTIENKISVEALNDIGKNIIIEDIANKFENEFGCKPQIFYFYFKYGDAENNFITLFMSNVSNGVFVCRLPKNRNKYLLQTLGKVNSHLILRIKNFGYHADDFIYNYESYIITYHTR